MKKYFLLLIAIVLSACASATATPNPTFVPPTLTAIPPTSIPLEFTSPAFANGEAIPLAYTCDGDNISPAFTWAEPPANTQSFALIMEDPDAPGIPYVHWVVINIPASSRGFAEAVPYGAKLEDGSIQGLNSGSSNGYQGPCPPTGTHHYSFKLYALDITLSLHSDARKKDVQSAIKGHVLTSAELIGTFIRP